MSENFIAAGLAEIAYILGDEQDDLTIEQVNAGEVTGIGTTMRMAYDYYAYGTAEDVVRNEKDCNKRWQSKEFDGEHGKYYFGSRLFDPFFALWMSPDPAGQFANPYTYGGDPVNYIDPNGEEITLAVGAAAGAAGGAAGGASGLGAAATGATGLKSGSGVVVAMAGGAVEGAKGKSIVDLKQNASGSRYSINEEGASILTNSWYAIQDNDALTYVMSYSVNDEEFEKSTKKCPTNFQCFRNKNDSKRLIVPPYKQKYAISSVLGNRYNGCQETDGILLATYNGTGNVWEYQVINGNTYGERVTTYLAGATKLLLLPR